MTSSFSWLDYSEDDRQRTLDVIDLFRESDTRDELGIGAVRDSFADLLFPGLSTIQTRAKYFLFVPWIYRALEDRKISSAQIERRAQREEVKLIYSLLESEDTYGVIGAVSKDDLQRFPSSIYWRGLATWNIRLFSGSLSQYHRSLDRYYRARSQQRRTDDGDLVGASVKPNWHLGLPTPPEGFPKEASLKLTYEQADYLRERLLVSVRDSLVAYLVDCGHPIGETSFPWEIQPDEDFPDQLEEWLRHARNFSELIWGAALLYNLMLAELDANDELVVRYRDRLEEWRTILQQRMGAMKAWDQARFWQIVDRPDVRVPVPTRRFIDQWWELALSDLDAISESRQALDLIRRRERALKKGQARLFSQRAREMWSGAAGTARLSYRWKSSAQQIITDILQGFNG